MKDFSLFTYKDAADLFTKDRRPETASRARKFFDGDHWQGERGYAGTLPPPGYRDREVIVENIRKEFTFENIIFEAADTHAGGVLGNEPTWDFARQRKRQNVRREDSALFNLGETLTAHWDERELLQTLTKTAEGLALEGLAVLHLYFPQGLLGEGGTLPDGLTLADALDYLYCEVLAADVAGVFTDPASKKKIGVYLFEEGDEAKVKKADICYLDENKKTVLRRLTEGVEGSENFGPYDLGGRLFLHQLERPALITDAVQSLQRSLNLTRTNKTRNVSQAGNRSRDVINAQAPRKQSATGPAQKNEGVEEVGAYKATPGHVNMLFGLPLRNDAGKIIGYTQPQVNVTEPVPVDTFVKSRDDDYAAILGQCFMLHKLISGDATASGKSREQARKEYERSLKKTAVVIDAAGRWLLETELRMAAELAKDFSVRDLRAVFECQIEKVPVSGDERQQNREDVKEGLMSPETAMSRNGIQDTGAEVVKIEAYQEEKAKRAKAMQPPSPPVEDKSGEELVA